MESIDALAKAINEFKGGLVLVSHDMRLIGQVAKEIWICDNKKITKHKGDIQSFKMHMRAKMGIDGDQVVKLRGDASVMKKDDGDGAKQKPKKAQPKLEVVAPPAKSHRPEDDSATTTTSASSSTFNSVEASTAGSSNIAAAPKKGGYVPPHRRKKLAS